MPEDPLADLETALAEAIHRARNDLHAVIAMLRLQANAAADPAARTALLAAEARVRALSHLNARLDAQADGAAATIGSAAFLKGLTTDLRDMHFGQRPVALEVRAEPHRLALVHARPLGLVLNELVVNALKYAFPEDRPGTVSIAFRSSDGDYVLSVRDDGVGIDPAAPPQGTGLRRRVVRALTSQIGGTFEVRQGKGGVGTECIVRWPAGSLTSAETLAAQAPAVRPAGRASTAPPVRLVSRTTGTSASAPRRRRPRPPGGGARGRRTGSRHRQDLAPLADRHEDVAGRRPPLSSRGDRGRARPSR